MAHTNALGNLFDVEGALGNKNDVRPSRDTAVHRNPTRVAAHHFHHDHALMCFRGGMHAVNGFGRGVHRGVETKAEVGPHQIVVDGLGNADYFQAQLVHALGHAHGVVSANGDQGFHTVGPQDFHAALQSAFTLGRVGPRSAQDGASPRQNARDRIHVHVHGLVLVNPPPPFHEAHKLIVIVHGALAHHRSYDGVQSRAVPTAGQNPDSHVRQYPSTDSKAIATFLHWGVHGRGWAEPSGPLRRTADGRACRGGFAADRVSLSHRFTSPLPSSIYPLNPLCLLLHSRQAGSSCASWGSIAAVNTLATGWSSRTTRARCITCAAGPSGYCRGNRWSFGSRRFARNLPRLLPPTRQNRWPLKTSSTR